MSVSLNICSPVHRCDARVKIVLLFAFTIAVFCVKSWLGMGICAVAILALMVVSRVPFSSYFKMLPAVLVLAAFTVVFNCFSWVDGQMVWTWEGCNRGCLYGVRIVLLVLSSLVVCFSSTAEDLMEALRSLLAPLRIIRVPVDDIAMVLSMAIRFIPLLAEELGRIRNAQWARGASYDEGGLWSRLRAGAGAMVPLFIGMFRRAGAIGTAMDARAYGMTARRGVLSRRVLTRRATAALIVGLVFCVTVAFV